MSCLFLCKLFVNYALICKLVLSVLLIMILINLAVKVLLLKIDYITVVCMSE